MGPSFSKKVSPDLAGTNRAAAERIVALAQEFAGSAGRFTVALAGGSTPAGTYALLAAEPFSRQMPWAKTRIYFGDERHVPHDSQDSNYRMASEALLKKVPLPEGSVVPIPTDHEDPASCAEWYEDMLRVHFQRQSDPFPSFDLLLLGIGADGHTAGLFRGTPAAAERQRWMTWCDPIPGMTPPVRRISIAAPVIWRATNVFVLATGAEKASTLAKVFADHDPSDSPPARLLRQCHGTVTFFLDKAAAASLP
jgi:6-phosphogluconolactonase